MRIQAKTPAIAHYLLEQNIIPVFPYTRPKGVKGNLRPNDFVYNQVLTYRTTTRDGYREYKSDPKVCASCPLLSVCTQSRNNQKVLTRDVWKDDLEFCEEIRHQRGMKELYKKRKETIE